MKKYISVLLTLIMIFGSCSLSPSVLASDATAPATTTQLVTEDGYDFEITEVIGSDYEINRSYHNLNKSRSIDFERTKALLKVLGYTEDVISHMSESELLEYATAEDIFVSVAYSKYDNNSGEIVGLDPTDAIAQAEELNQARIDYYLHPENQATPYGDMPNQSNEDGEFLDNYMRIIQDAIPYGDGTFRYTTTATWLVMPFFRGYDSIGSCANNGRVLPNTENGYFWYNICTNVNGDISTNWSGYNQFEKTDTIINGIWYGKGAIFRLPLDMTSTELGFYAKVCTDLSAHFEYKGEVTHPSLETNFNSCGTYSHSTLALSISPSISINPKGLTASIGLNSLGASDRRTATCPINYIPRG